MKRLRHRETIRVILHLQRPAQQPLQIRLHRLPVHAHRVRILHRPLARIHHPRRPHPQRMRRPRHLRHQIAIQPLDPLQNRPVPLLRERRHPLAEHLPPLAIQNDPLDLRAAQINAHSHHN